MLHNQNIKRLHKKLSDRMVQNIRIWVLCILLNTSLWLVGYGQTYTDREDSWVASMLETMTLDEKIGQLFVVRAYSRNNASEDKVIMDFIKKYHIGGLCFFQGSPDRQAQLIHKYQKSSSIPMFMALDAEWGLGMRFPTKTISFPKQMMLGALQDNTLIYELGREIARQCKVVGININFAPVVDVNSNRNNPVIFDRSFGESPFHVTSKGYMYMKGMEDEGVLSCVKHFPGHGDTEIDSHHDLPVIPHNLERLAIYDFYPFRRLVKEGVSAVMVGHLHIPAIDSMSKLPATLSESIIQNLLRKDMGYDGLIFTDAMDMKAITQNFPLGIAEAEAFLAGNDIILMPKNLPVAFKTIKSYVEKGKISQDRLEASLRRILQVKYRLGLPQSEYISSQNLWEQINNNYALTLKQSIAESALTIVNDKQELFPWKKFPESPIATLSVNLYQKSKFQSRMDSYVDAHHFQWMPTNLRKEYAQKLQTLSQYEEVIIAIHTSGKRGDYTSQLPDILIRFIEELQTKTRLRVVLFGSPYLLKKLENVEHLLINYDNDPITQDATAQGLMGVYDINGQLPFTSSEKWQAGHGLKRSHLDRLGFSLPERVQMNSDALLMVDSIMRWAVKIQAIPGGQIVIAKDRRIIYQKAFGKLSPKDLAAQNNTIYDLASITKILSTSLAFMHMEDSNLVHINKPLDHYMYRIDTTDKASIIIGDILAHHSRLSPWVSFYKYTLPDDKKSKLNTRYYRKTLQEGFTSPVASNMFLRNDYIDSMYVHLFDTPLRKSMSYKYSDLGFYFLYKVLENKTKFGVEEFVKTNFYKPLGLRYTGFNPIYKHDLKFIAPSEVDNYFRHQTIRGHVHDMGAAMMGGVAGHAGLFSTATEVTILMQMLLNKGSYGGIQFFKPEIVDKFTSRHPQSTRRGYGFDMKEQDKNRKLNVSSYAPASVFGHTGFTGTATWADPENNLIYTFCSNRTYPSSKNIKLSKYKIRENIQTVIYKSMQSYKDPF